MDSTQLDDDAKRVLTRKIVLLWAVAIAAWYARGLLLAAGRESLAMHAGLLAPTVLLGVPALVYVEVEIRGA